MIDRELDFRKSIVDMMSSDFIIHNDAIFGKCRLNGRKVRIDLFLRPLPHIIQKGFDDCWFGIETKWFDPSDTGKDRKFRDTVWQSLEYSYSDFEIDGKTHRPLFVLMALSGLEPGDPGFEYSVYHLVTRGKIGILKREKKGWAMNFAGGCYYCSWDGRKGWNPGYLHEDTVE